MLHLEVDLILWAADGGGGRSDECVLAVGYRQARAVVGYGIVETNKSVSARGERHMRAGILYERISADCTFQFFARNAVATGIERVDGVMAVGHCGTGGTGGWCLFFLGIGSKRYLGG